MQHIRLDSGDQRLARHWLGILIALLGALSATPQANSPDSLRIIHQSWTFRDGSPEGVCALAQTTDGYLWLGTDTGLFRFDGVRFERFTPPFGDPLASNNIASLFAAKDGRLWIGYRFGTFSVLKGGKMTTFGGLTTGTVNGFAEDRRGIVWAATNAGVWRFDGTSWQQNPAGWNPDSRLVAQVGVDGQGILWALTDSRSRDHPRQLLYLAPGTDRFRNGGGPLSSIGFTFDADRNVVTAPRRSQPDQGSVAASSEPPAYPILKDGSAQVLDRNQGIWFFPGSGSPYRHAATGPLDLMVGTATPASSQVFAVNFYRYANLVDREGSVWVGDSTGIHRFSFSRLQEPEFSRQPERPNFVLAPDDDGAVWVSAGNGTGSSALYRVAGRKAEFQSLQLGLSNFAYRAPDKSYWFGGEGGLWRMVNDHLLRINLPPELADKAYGLVTITQDSNTGMWVSFGSGGLYLLRNEVWQKFGGRKDLPSTGVIIAFTDKAGRVWFGSTQSRLAVLDRDRVTTYGPQNGVAVGNVLSFHEKDTDFWIGGEFGLQKLEHGVFRTIRPIDPELFRGISGIVQESNGDLWLNGLAGIVHVRREELSRSLKQADVLVKAESFGRQDGLPGLASQLARMPTAIRGSDGRLWFTVNNGVVWIDPENSNRATSAPFVAIQGISGDDERYLTDAPLLLPPGTSSLQFSFSAVSLSNPEAIRYRYRLTETDKDWRETGGAKSVSFRNLPPGRYHFTVNATDASGTWSDKTATAEFSVQPTFVQTNWFRGLFVLAVLIAVMGLYRLRMYQVAREFQAQNAERMRIARELHDTLLQSFQASLFELQATRNMFVRYPEKAIESLDQAIKVAATAVSEGRDAIQDLRAQPASGGDLPQMLTVVGQDLAHSQKAVGSPPAFQLTVEGERLNLEPLVEDEVFRITRELIRNSFMHAAASRIEVEFRYSRRSLQVHVRDDGKGIDPEVLKSGGRIGHWGIPGMRERVKRLGGELEFWSEVDSGTEAVLTVPIHGRPAFSPDVVLSWFRRKSTRDDSLEDAGPPKAHPSGRKSKP